MYLRVFDIEQTCSKSNSRDKPMSSDFKWVSMTSESNLAEEDFRRRSNNFKLFPRSPSWIHQRWCCYRRFLILNRGFVFRDHISKFRGFTFKDHRSKFRVTVQKKNQANPQIHGEKHFSKLWFYSYVLWFN